MFVRKPIGMIPLGRPKRRWEDHAKMRLKEARCEGVDWVHCRALVNKVMNLRFHESREIF